MDILFKIVGALVLIQMALYAFAYILPWLIVLAVVAGIAAGITAGLVINRRLPSRDGQALPPADFPIRPTPVRRPRGVRDRGD